MKTPQSYLEHKRKKLLPDITPNNNGQWRLSKINNSYQIPETDTLFDLDITETGLLKDISYFILYSDHDVSVNLPAGFYTQNGDTVIDISADEMAELAIRKEMSFSDEMLISYNKFKLI